MPVAWATSRSHNYKVNPAPVSPPPKPKPEPARFTLPPPDADYVLVKSPDATRRSAIAARCRAVDGLYTVEVATTEDALNVLLEAPKPPLVALIDAYDENDDGELDQDEMSWPLLRMIQRPFKPYRDSIRQTMVIIVSKAVHESPRHTLDALSAGAQMVTSDLEDCTRALRLARLSSVPRGGDGVTCPCCGLQGLTPAQLFAHYSLMHTCEASPNAACPLCGVVCRAGKGFLNFAAHLEASHEPEGTDADGDGFLDSQELDAMLAQENVVVARGPVYEPPPHEIEYTFKPHAAYALLVVRRPSDGKYLVVLESSHTANCQGQPRWWIPAGKAAPGETMAEAAVASCLRDTNVKVTVKGIIRILLEPSDNASIRSVLYCEPDAVQPQKMKAVPSFHSAGAAWVTADEFAMDVSGSECRSCDPKVLFPGVSSGAVHVEPFGSTWNALEALVAELGRFSSAPIRLRPAVTPSTSATHPSIPTQDAPREEAGRDATKYSAGPVGRDMQAVSAHLFQRKRFHGEELEAVDQCNF